MQVQTKSCIQIEVLDQRGSLVISRVNIKREGFGIPSVIVALAVSHPETDFELTSQAQFHISGWAR